MAVTRKSRGQSRGINARAWFYSQSFHTFSDVDSTPARLAAPEAGSGPGFPHPVTSAQFPPSGTMGADREAAAHPTENLPVNAASLFLNEFDFGLGITSLSALVDEVMGPQVSGQNRLLTARAGETQSISLEQPTGPEFCIIGVRTDEERAVAFRQLKDALDALGDTCLMCESTQNVSKCTAPGCTEHFCPACMIEHNNEE